MIVCGGDHTAHELSAYVHVLVTYFIKMKTKKEGRYYSSFVECLDLQFTRFLGIYFLFDMVNFVKLLQKKDKMLLWEEKIDYSMNSLYGLPNTKFEVQ